MRERPAATRQKSLQQPIQAQRQEQRRPQQQRGQQDETREQAVPYERDQRQQPQCAGQQRLTPQPARLLPVPGFRLGEGQHRQARGPEQAAGAGQQGAEQTDRQPAQPPAPIQAQMPRHLGAVQATQAAGQIGQQQTGKPVAADHPGHPAEKRQRTKLHGERSDQQPQAHPAHAQGAQQRAALLQRQADGGMDDEQPDDERQKAKGTEVEMEAVGQAGQVGGLAALGQLQSPGQIHRQLPSEALAHQHPRKTLRRAKQPLGDADIHQQNARRQLRTHFQRR
ncbi:hypothetical protein D3C78_1121660 [compost metagenome]